MPAGEWEENGGAVAIETCMQEASTILRLHFAVDRLQEACPPP